MPITRPTDRTGGPGDLHRGVVGVFASWLAALIVSAAIFGVATADTRNESSNVDSVVTALQNAERAELNGDTDTAFELYSQLLETAASRTPDSSGISRAPEIEVAVRRLYDLAGKLRRYRDALPRLEEWLEPAPGGWSAVNAAVARYYAGAATLYQTGNDTPAREIWRPLGFLSKWWVIGPFDNERGGGFLTAFGPEGDSRPIEQQLHDGKNRKVRWRPLPVTPITGWVDFDQLLYPRDQALAYAMTFVRCERELDAALRLGSDEGFRVWINGALVTSNPLSRPMRFDQNAFGVRLKKGWNSVLIKVTEEDGRWEFRARLTTPAGGSLDGWEEALPPEEADLPAPPGANPNSRAATENNLDVDSGSISTLQHRIEASPNDHWSHYLLGVLLYKTRAHDLTQHPDRDALTRAIELHGTDDRDAGVPAGYLHALADASRRMHGIAADRDDNAWRVALERAQAANPPSLMAYLDLASYYSRTFGNLLKAEELLLAALDLNPRLFAAHILLGELRSRRGSPAAVERAVEKCAQLGQRTSALSSHRADRHRNAGRISEAERLLRGLLAENFSDSQARSTLVSVLLDGGQTDQALAVLSAARRARPFDLSSRRRMVSILKGQGEIEKALAVQQEVTSIAAEDPDELRAEGDLLWRLARRDEAHEVWQFALEVQPNFAELREYVEHVERRRDPFVEDFRRDVNELITTAQNKEIDADDPAELLLDLKAIDVNTDGTRKEFAQQVIRILNDAGARQFDRFSTYYSEGDERVDFKVVRVVRPDGRQEHARLGVFTGGGSGEYRAASIDVPPLNPGDIVEVQYVKESTRQSFFGDYFGHREYFRATYPIGEKVFCLRVPNDRTFHFYQRSLDAQPEKTEDAESATLTYIWTARGMSKIKPEPGMPPEYESTARLDISTFSDWKEFSTWYENLINKQFESDADISAKARELTTGKNTDLEKVEALYHFVAQEVRYNAWEFGVHGFKPYNAATIFARRFGDCKDKSTLLATLLKEVGIEAYPVLIRATDSRGDEDLTLPMVNHFNHCITYVPGSGDHDELFLDGTAQYNGVADLPTSDRGAKVLVVTPEGGSIRTIPWNDPGQFQLTEEASIRVSEDRSAHARIRIEARGDYASALRRYFEIPGQRTKNLERIYGARFAGLIVESNSFSELSDLSVPVRFEVELKIPNFLKAAAEGLSLTPPDDFFSTNKSFDSVSSLKDREKDIVVGSPRRAELTVTIELPEGATVTSLPENEVVERDFGKLTISFEGERNRLELRRVLLTTSPRVSVTDYKGFRALAASLERLQDQKILISIRQ